MDLSSSCDLSLFVGGTIDIEGLEGWNWSRWKQEVLHERRVDEISSSPTIYEGCSGNGSHSVL